MPSGSTIPIFNETHFTHLCSQGGFHNDVDYTFVIIQNWKNQNTHQDDGAWYTL